MLYVVYFETPNDIPVLVAAFLMKTDAEHFAETAQFGNGYKIKETTLEAWSAWTKIRECIKYDE